MTVASNRVSQCVEMSRCYDDVFVVKIGSGGSVDVSDRSGGPFSFLGRGDRFGQDSHSVILACMLILDSSSSPVWITQSG